MVGVLVDSFGIPILMIPAIGAGLSAVVTTLWGIFVFKTRNMDDSYAILPTNSNLEQSSKNDKEKQAIGEDI